MVFRTDQKAIKTESWWSASWLALKLEYSLSSHCSSINFSSLNSSSFFTNCFTGSYTCADMMICQVDLTSWLVCQVELVTASGCYLRKIFASVSQLYFFWELLARRKRCLRDFSVIFLRVLVCLKSVFSDGQDVKYDRDIKPHQHLFHGTNSHKHSAHRDNRVNTTWKWRGRHTVDSNRHAMSRLTYCLQSTAENPPTLQQHCQIEVVLSLWRTSQNDSKIFFYCFAATQLAR